MKLKMMISVMAWMLMAVYAGCVLDGYLPYIANAPFTAQLFPLGVMGIAASWVSCSAWEVQ